MEKAKKLPSGNWRIRVTDPTTKQRKSITASTKSEVELLAAEYINGIVRRKPSDLTVSQAVDEYIKSKDTILSPSSIRGYRIIWRNALTAIADIPLAKLTEKDLQKWVNINAKSYSPKSIKSQYGLVTASLRQNKIRLDFDTVLLPRIQKKEPIVPNLEQMGIILDMVEGTSIELAVTLALTLGLRQSEIAGLKWSDYDGAHLYIHGAVVPNNNNRYEYKESTKSEASTRILDIGGVTKQRLDNAERKSEFISPMLPSSVLRKFQQLCKRNGLPPFTMHAQRHANASLMLAEGIPDKYAMERLGQSSPNMIKNVYQHLYDTKRTEASEIVKNAFENISQNGHEKGHEN